MKKELRNHTVGFIEYNKEIKKLCDENFREKREKDIALFWIRCINFEIYSMQSQGRFQYNSSKLSYGIEKIKLDINQLTEEQFQEILNFYEKKGYELNYSDDFITESLEFIVIKWNQYRKQTINDKMYLLKFKKNKLKKLYCINIKESGFIKAFFFTAKDFYWYLFMNHSYCLNAITQNRKTNKSREAIEKRKNKKNKKKDVT